tara:strand:- start:275 stop:697 length:423 start_codon:yes stop_codon:yes gene_type:complete
MPPKQKETAWVKPARIPFWWWQVMTQHYRKDERTEELSKQLVKTYAERQRSGDLKRDRERFDQWRKSPSTSPSTARQTPRPTPRAGRPVSAPTDGPPPGWVKSYTTLTTNGRKIMKLESASSGRTARSIKEAWRIHNGEE